MVRLPPAWPRGPAVWAGFLSLGPGPKLGVSRMIFMRGRRRMLFAGAGGALALLAAVALPASAQTSAPAAAGGKLAGGPLGMNIAPWDALYTGSSGAVIQGLMKKPGINQIRYGGPVPPHPPHIQSHNTT